MARLRNYRSRQVRSFRPENCDRFVPRVTSDDVETTQSRRDYAVTLDRVPRNEWGRNLISNFFSSGQGSNNQTTACAVG